MASPKTARYPERRGAGRTDQLERGAQPGHDGRVLAHRPRLGAAERRGLGVEGRALGRGEEPLDVVVPPLELGVGEGVAPPEGAVELAGPIR